MVSPLQIGVVADHRPDHETHIATDAALAHAAATADAEIDVRWVATDLLAGDTQRLADFHALLVAPGSPYRSMQGALDAITYARTFGMPLLGTCGGFQHMVLEYARNVAGIQNAQHGEYNPQASDLVITELACSLAGQTMEVTIAPDTIAWDAYQTGRTAERYYCSFGLNPRYRSDLEKAGLTVSGTDTDDEFRIIELPDHPFYLATLFVPQARSAPTAPHPLIAAFVRAGLERAERAPTSRAP